MAYIFIPLLYSKKKRLKRSLFQGSYAGARAAHMRVLYPDIVAGSIASSAVVHATISYWEYYDLIRNYTPVACRDAIENTVKTVDWMLDFSVFTRAWVKRLFGLEGLQDDADFGSVLSVSSSQCPISLYFDFLW